MKSMYFVIIGFIIAGCFFVQNMSNYYHNTTQTLLKQALANQEQVVKTSNEVNQFLANEESEAAQTADLINFTYKVMDLSPKSKLSQAKKEILAKKIVSIVQDNIEGIDAQQQYISMLKIESAFDNNRNSSAGAVGLGQIMPQTFKNTLEDCGIEATPEDIRNEDINLEVGSCYFSVLLQENDNNPRLAALAYNGGNKVVEKFKKLGDVNQESSNYALKVEYVKELARK